MLTAGVYLQRKNTPQPNSHPQIISENLENLEPTLPAPKTTELPASLVSNSYILLDSATNQIILETNSHQRIYPASTTKVATALVALNSYPQDEVITITNDYTVGKVMGLKKNDQYTVSSLVGALLVYSANDSAVALASHNPEGTNGFMQEVNQFLKANNILETNFISPDGVDNPNHYSTVYDLAQIARLAIKNPIIRSDVLKKEIIVSDIYHKKTNTLTSTNELLEKYPEIVGLKTGWTPEASGAFVGVINYKNKMFISVVGKTEDRFGDTVKILNWVKQNY